MAWDFGLAVRGDLVRGLDADRRAGEQANTAVLKRAANGLKADVRRELRQNGLGGLENAVRSAFQPRRGASFDATAMVFSKARVKRPGGPVDLIAVFEERTEIEAAGGRWLAIATDNVGRRASPEDYRADAVFLPSARRPRQAAVLVHKRTGAVLFVLVRRVALRKRLNLDPLIEKRERQIDDATLKEWDKRSAATGQRLGGFV